jgi:hypothetical protein
MAVPARVVSDHPVLAGERRHLRLPHPQVRTSELIIRSGGPSSGPSIR